MKTIKMLVAIVAGSSSAAFAAAGTQSDEAGILTYFFLGFFALIIVSQLVPAMILFFGMVKGLLFNAEKKQAKLD